MKEFHFFVDEKVNVWLRDHVIVKADSLEEAVEKVKDEDYQYITGEVLYDTTECLTPEENGGHATLEIYEEDAYAPIYSNGNS